MKQEYFVNSSAFWWAMVLVWIYVYMWPNSVLEGLFLLCSRTLFFSLSIRDISGKLVKYMYVLEEKVLVNAWVLLYMWLFLQWFYFCEFRKSSPKFQIQYMAINRRGSRVKVLGGLLGAWQGGQ